VNWPNHADYAEAVQNPEVCFDVPELHSGIVATTPLGLPRALSGNFASVYEVAGNGQVFAVRCFVRQVTNQQDRYAALERHIDGRDLPCMVPFVFVSRGIRVCDRWYPIVKMNWVKGMPLHHYVERQLAAPDALAALAVRWRSTMAGLKQHRIGHGDLQHGNILVTPQGELRLVDYDGMYVPVFVREQSPELGHANFQHPRRSPDFYDERLDHFPELLIYLSLRALAAEPALWNEFFNGDNLVVTAVDLRMPQCSGLWPRLLKSPDDDVRRLTVLLLDYLRRAPRDVPGLEEVLEQVLPTVQVPETLEFPDEEPPVPAGEPVRVSASPGEGPLAAMNIERTGAGSPRPGDRPLLVEVFGWSALFTAVLALIPPLRTVAGMSALGLSLLAWLMPGRIWQPARVAASIAAVLALFFIVARIDLRVAARLEHPEPGTPRIEAAADAPPWAERLPDRAESGWPASTTGANRPGATSINAPGAEVPEPAASEPPVEPGVARRETSWKAHVGTVSRVVSSADGVHVVSTAGDRSMVVWNRHHQAPLFSRTNVVEPIIQLTALTNVGIVATLDAVHQLQWWSLDGAVPLKSLALDADSLAPPAISPDGQLIALGGRDRRQVSVRFQTVPPVQKVLSGLSSWAKLIRFSGDSRLMAVACLDDSVAWFRCDSLAARHRVEYADAGILDVAFSPDGSHLLALGRRGQMRVWDATSGALAAEQIRQLRNPVLAAAFWQGGARFLIGSEEGVTVLSISPGTTAVRDVPTPTAVTSIAGLPNGDGFVTGHSTGEVVVWQFPPETSGTPPRVARP